jgi:glycosyltransferase involved in cell wall biosynthesis
VSTALPPAPTGQARVLGHLLAGGEAANHLLVSEFPPETATEPGAVPLGRIVGLASRAHALGQHRLLDRWPAFNVQGGLALSAWRRAREIVDIARAFAPEVLVGCTANPLDVPATALAAGMLRRPFVAYLFDDPVHQWAQGPLRSFAARAEPLWARRLAVAIAPNEFMARDFARRTGRVARIVRNPAAEEAFASDSEQAVALHADGPLRIVYTGTVYHAQADAFANLLLALDRLGIPAGLDIYTSQTAHEVSAFGVGGPFVRIRPHVQQHESYRVQRQAGLLFLPLAFNSGIPEVIDSSAPAKLGEYLASGRPLLVHAPATSFVVDHVRSHDAGFVVDQPDPAALVAVLAEIVAGGEGVVRRAANARRLAALYRADAARAAFWGALSDVAGPGQALAE